jgi:hypothetical protein
MSELLALTGLSESEFWAKYEWRDGCLEWTGSRYADNYGRVWVPGQRRHVRAHRIAWELSHGPTRLHVLHHCDNPPCGCHLFVGSDKANSDDKILKGRLVLPPLRYGTTNNKARLTTQEVTDIRERYRAGETQTALAREFGAHQTTLSLIVRDVTRRQG